MVHVVHPLPPAQVVFRDLQQQRLQAYCRLINGDLWVTLRSPAPNIPPEAKCYKDILPNNYPSSCLQNGLFAQMEWGTNPDWYRRDTHWRAWIPIPMPASWFDIRCGGVCSDTQQESVGDRVVFHPDFKLAVLQDLRDASQILSRWHSRLRESLEWRAPGVLLPPSSADDVLDGSFASSSAMAQHLATVQRHFLELLGALRWLMSIDDDMSANLSFVTKDLRMDIQQRLIEWDLPQAYGRGVLVDLSRDWREINIPLYIDNGIPVHYMWTPALQADPRFRSLSPTALNAPCPTHAASWAYSSDATPPITSHLCDQFLQLRYPMDIPVDEARTQCKIDNFVVDFEGWKARSITNCQRQRYLSDLWYAEVAGVPSHTRRVFYRNRPRVDYYDAYNYLNAPAPENLTIIREVWKFFCCPVPFHSYLPPISKIEEYVGGYSIPSNAPSWSLQPQPLPPVATGDPYADLEDDDEYMDTSTHLQLATSAAVSTLDQGSSDGLVHSTSPSQRWSRTHTSPTLASHDPRSSRREPTRSSSFAPDRFGLDRAPSHRSARKRNGMVQDVSRGRDTKRPIRPHTDDRRGARAQSNSWDQVPRPADAGWNKPVNNGWDVSQKFSRWSEAPHKPNWGPSSGMPVDIEWGRPGSWGGAYRESWIDQPIDDVWGDSREPGSWAREANCAPLVGNPVDNSGVPQQLYSGDRPGETVAERVFSAVESGVCLSGELRVWFHLAPMLIISKDSRCLESINNLSTDGSGESGPPQAPAIPVNPTADQCDAMDVSPPSPPAVQSLSQTRTTLHNLISPFVTEVTGVPAVACNWNQMLMSHVILVAPHDEARLRYRALCHPAWTVQDIMTDALNRCIPFQLGVRIEDAPKLAVEPAPECQDEPLAWQNSTSNFAESWLAACKDILSRPHSRWYTYQGGLISRLVRQIGGPGILQAAAKGPFITFIHDQHESPDGLIVGKAPSEHETAIVLGHVSLSGDTVRSLWPTEDIFRTFVCWQGEWNEQCEYWFQERWKSIVSPRGEMPKRQSEWKRMSRYGRRDRVDWICSLQTAYEGFMEATGNQWNGHRITDIVFPESL